MIATGCQSPTCPNAATLCIVVPSWSKKIPVCRGCLGVIRRAIMEGARADGESEVDALAMLQVTSMDGAVS
jgi:hypothetical protein